MENISKLMISNFEKEVDAYEDWIDPYDSVWLKVITIFIYIVEGRHP